jgi:quinol monooxygenase YgiN
MQRQIFCLLIIGAAVLPALAQSETLHRGIQAGNIVATYTGEVLPGEEGAFKQMVSKIIASVEKEPGTIAYEWSMRADGKTFDVVEIYKDSSAVTTHVQNLVANFGGDLGKIQKGTRFVIYGNPDAEAKKALDGFHAEYEAPIGGFIR